MIGFDAIVVIIVILFIIISLYLEIIGASFTFLIGVIILGIFGILSPAEILSGFSNKEIAVILMLLLLGDIIRRTSIVELAFNRIFKTSKSPRGFMAQMMLLVAEMPLPSLIDGFFNTRPDIGINDFFIALAFKKRGGQ